MDEITNYYRMMPFVASDRPQIHSRQIRWMNVMPLTTMNTIRMTEIRTTTGRATA